MRRGVFLSDRITPNSKIKFQKLKNLSGLPAHKSQSLLSLYVNLCPHIKQPIDTNLDRDQLYRILMTLVRYDMIREFVWFCLPSNIAANFTDEFKQGKTAKKKRSNFEHLMKSPNRGKEEFFPRWRIKAKYF